MRGTITRRRLNDETTLAEGFDDLRSNYNAAQSSRFRRRRTGLSPMGSGADFHYRSEADFLRLLELARDMDRNDAVVGQAIDRAVVNTIQDGIKLDPQTGDPEVDADLVARWEAWAGDASQCDLAAEMTFPDMEQLVLRQMFVDGDVLALANRLGSLELVEAHRLRRPQNTKRNVVHGVLLDGVRRRLEYWLTKDDIDPNHALIKVSEIKPFAARDSLGNRLVFHVYNPKRVSQTRGVTVLAPIFDVLGMFEDINFAKLVQQQIVSCFAVLEELEGGLQPSKTNAATGVQTTESLSDGSSRLLEGISPGMRYKGDPGVKLTGFSPNVPNPEFFPHVKLILTMVGINLGLPLTLMLLDASETNFSGWRGAVDQARLGFRRNQKALIGKFHRPVYLWKVRQWLLVDDALRKVATRLDGSGDSIFAHRWNPPTWPYIEPKKDAEGDAIRLRHALISPRRLQAERGRDYDELALEIVQDRAKMIELALERAILINNKFTGAEVTWRDLAPGFGGDSSSDDNAGEIRERGAELSE